MQIFYTQLIETRHWGTKRAMLGYLLGLCQEGNPICVHSGILLKKRRTGLGMNPVPYILYKNQGMDSQEWKEKQKISVNRTDFVVYLNHIMTRTAVPLVAEGQTPDTVGTVSFLN